jgi:hypothetical protein
VLESSGTGGASTDGRDWEVGSPATEVWAGGVTGGRSRCGGGSGGEERCFFRYLLLVYWADMWDRMPPQQRTCY